jgi:hypothetical protein
MITSSTTPTHHRIVIDLTTPDLVSARTLHDFITGALALHRKVYPQDSVIHNLTEVEIRQIKSTPQQEPAL